MPAPTKSNRCHGTRRSIRFSPAAFVAVFPSRIRRANEVACSVACLSGWTGHGREGEPSCAAPARVVLCPGTGGGGAECPHAVAVHPDAPAPRRRAGGQRALPTRGSAGGAVVGEREFAPVHSPIPPADQTTSNSRASSEFLPAFCMGRGSGWAKSFRSTARARREYLPGANPFNVADHAAMP